MTQTPRTVVRETPIWSHSWHCKNEVSNAVGIKEKIVVEYSDGSVEYKDNLRLIEDPMRPFWITLPQFRDHEFKKEFEDIINCEQYMAHDSQLVDNLETALQYRPAFRKRSLRQLCNNPYVYGADIDTQTIIRQHYNNKTPAGVIAKFSRGGLDIETEIRGEKKIHLITFIHENKIFTAALEEYCKIKQDDGTFIKATSEDCLEVVDKMIGSLIRKHKFDLEFKIFTKEIDIIRWIFQKIHQYKTDYIGVWNMGFDVPKIMSRIEELGYDPASIMCHPEVPKRFQFVEFYEDQNKKLQHFTDRWDWSSIAGYSQFIDSMCLYARLRKVKGRDSSYALDNISDKEVGESKLKFGAITNHWYMQNNRFLEYIAYNINDVLIMQLMEWQNNDMSALNALTGMSLLSQFSRQTVMVRNNAYHYGRRHGKVPASAGMSMFTEYDKMQSKSGGTVLPPNKAVGVGVSVLEEVPSRTTQVSLLTNDLDVSSMYPSITSAFNISKETALGTVIGINGFDAFDAEVFFGGVNRPDINAVPLANQFFGLYSYTEMANEYRKHLSTYESRNGEKINIAA